MGRGKQEKHSKTSSRNPRKPLAPKRANTKSKKNIRTNGNTENKITKTNEHANSNNNNVQSASASEQLSFFLNQYQSANGIQLSSLELESIKDTCIIKLSQDLAQNPSTLSEHIKSAFGMTWKEVLFEKNLLEGKIDSGNPAVLIISPSALRSLELFKGLRSLTKECPAVKLFSKHMKIEEQVSNLKNRVNIGSGTPSRIKKLFELEALGLSRLSLIVLDLHTDVKGYSLLTLPQVRDEFWDLYKSYFHNRLLEGDLRLCLYGSLPKSSETKKKKKDS